MAVKVKNNPAGRLYDLLYAARQRSHDKSVRAAWAAVFGIDEKDTSTLLKSLADLIDLVFETKESLSRLPDVDVALYLKPFTNIERVFSGMNLDAPWTQGVNALDEATLMGLQFGADRLARVSGFTEIDQSELDELREQVEHLLKDVLTAELPEPLSQLFIKCLEALRQALLGYRLRGVQGLEQEIERSVGAIVLHHEEIKASKAGSSEKKTWEAFFTLVTRINSMVTAAKNAKELAASGIQFLLEKLT